LEFLVLGPLEVRNDGAVLPLGGSGQRSLLAILILRANEVVGTDRLIDLLWGDEPPDSALHVLHVQVSRLRKVLESDPSNPTVLVTSARGYVLRTPVEAVDATRFETLLRTGRSLLMDDPAQASAKLDEALTLWRGEALADLALEPFAAPEIARLDELRLSAIEERMDAELALGHHAEVIGDLRKLATEHPLRERLTQQLMVALYRSDRQTEALAAYQGARSRLASELGIDPGSATQDLERAVLQHDPSLDLAEGPSLKTRAVAPTTDPRSNPVTREVRKTVTLVFCDVVGSTALGEALDPERLRRVMQRYFETMRTCIEQHGGTVEKFIGDAVMAVFGAPVLHEDDALRAVRAASDMRDALEGLNKELERDFGVNVSNRIGINTGEVVAGDPTGGDRIMTGDAVNVAARLEQAARPNDVLLGDSTYRLVREAVDVEDIEPVVAKGKTQPIAGFRLVRVLAGAPGFSRRLDAPLIGRRGELRLLAEAFERASQDQTCILFTVLGPAGIGKSRLVQEFLSTTGAGAQVLRGRCLPYGEGITYWPIVELIVSAANLAETDAPETSLGKITSLIDGVPEASIIAERLAQILGLAGADASPEETFWAVRKLFESVSRRAPLVVDLDDLEWAEPTLLDLVEHVADWSRDAPILLLCSARPELLDARPRWSGGKMNAASILLEPLTVPEAEAVAQNLMGLLPEEVVALVVETADGNPLFVEQFVGMLVDEGVIRRAQDGWVMDEDITAIATPPSVNALLEARLERLPARERATLEYASVEGKIFHLGSMHALVPEAEGLPTVQMLQALVRRDLIRPDVSLFPGDEGFRFRHNLIRDAAYARLPKETRATLHQRHANWLEATAGARATEFEEIVGWHLEQAFILLQQLGPVDEPVRAVGERAGELLTAAARRANDRGDHHAEFILLRRAVALPTDSIVTRAHRELDLSQAADGAGEHLRVSREALNKAMASAAEAGDRSLDVRCSAADLTLRAKEVDPEFDIEAETDKLARRLEDGSIEAHCLCVGLRTVAIVRAWQGREVLGREVAMRALEVARSVGLDSEARNCLDLLRRYYLAGPTPVAEALRELEELETAPEMNRAVKAGVEIMVSYQLLCAGRHGEAKAVRDRIEQEQLELGQIVDAAELLQLDTNLAAEDQTAAVTALRRSIEALEARGRWGNVGTNTFRLAATLAESTEGVALFEASALIEKARRLTLPFDRWNLVYIPLIGASLAARSGSLEEAERLARQAIDVAGSTDWIDFRGETWNKLAEVLFLAGRPDEAEEAAHRAIELFERRGNVENVAWTNRLLARYGMAKQH
jgi:class 3 adenylate cyclase/tetratricopeptide (TPR) repeat protein/DNA-binding winged helix-turn-helix (wHTH) protein